MSYNSDLVKAYGCAIDFRSIDVMIDFVIIVTSGSKYLDIDAYACIVAYAELLKLQEKQVKAVSTAPLNESIPPYVRSWPVEVTNEYLPNENDTYILVDASEMTKFEDFVNPDKIVEVIDHRPGFENFWEERLGDAAKIEKIGACGSQIYEEWVKADLISNMSQTSAKLLTLAILDNTLNFTAHTTTARDVKAYEALVKIAHVEETWASQYFSSCQETIESNLEAATKNDTKVLTFRGLGKSVTVGQLAVWDPEAILSENINFKDILSPHDEPWFMNIIDIKSGHNIIITDNEDIKIWLSELLDIAFENNKALTNGPYLRKEIMALNLKRPF